MASLSNRNSLIIKCRMHIAYNCGYNVRASVLLLLLLLLLYNKLEYTKIPDAFEIDIYFIYRPNILAHYDIVNVAIYLVMFGHIV